MGSGTLLFLNHCTIMEAKKLTIPERVKRSKHFRGWLGFHMKNRHIIREICSHLDQHIDKGKTRASVKTIIGIIRYSESIKIAGDYDYSINDAYTSLYGHILYHNFPKYRLIIKTRKLRA